MTNEDKENRPKIPFTFADTNKDRNDPADFSSINVLNSISGEPPLHYYLSKEQLSQIAQRKIENDLSVDRHYKMRVVNEEFDSKRREALEKSRQRRLLSHIVVSRDYYGQYVYRFDDGQRSQAVSPIFNGNLNLKSMVFRCMEDGRSVLKVAYGIEPLNREVLLLINDNIGSKLASELIKNGVGVMVSRRNKAEVFEQLISILIKTAQEVCLPYHHGWNLALDGAFRFYGKEELTFKEVIQHAS